MAFIYNPNSIEVPVVNQMVSADMGLQNAIAYLDALDIDCLLVVEAGQLQGWLTAQDVVKLAAQGRVGDDCALGLVMTQPPYILDSEEARDLALVLHYLQKYRVHQLPVVADNGEILGLVTAQGIMPLCSRQLDYLEQLELQTDQFINAQIDTQVEQKYLFQEITNSISGLIYIYDLEEQRNIYSNQYISTALGYSPLEIQQMGQNLFIQIIHPEDLPQILARAQATMTIDDDRLCAMEYRIRHANGSWRWWYSRDRPFRYHPDGRVKQMIGFAQDITDRKQIELELQASQHFLQTITDTIPGLVYIYDLQTHCNIYINSLAPEILGYTKAQIDEFGNNVLGQVIHPEDLATNIPLVMEQLAQGTIAKSEYRLRNAQGEWRWALEHTTVFQASAEGVPQQILGIAIDIHDRKQIELELQSSQHFLQTITETMPGLVYVYDLQAHCNIYINSLAPEILGYTKAQIDELGNNLLGQIFYPEDLAIITPLIMEQLAQGTIAQSEYRLRNAQGEWRWCLEHTNIFQASAEGVPQQILGIVIDIHDRKVAEAALQQINIDLDHVVAERSQELWQTSINLAHEINQKIEIEATLRQSEAFFRAVFEQAAVGINIAAANGKLVKVNQKMCQMFGYTEAELIAMTWMDVTAPEFVPRVEYRAKCDRGEISSWSVEKQILCKDGSRRWVNTTISLLQDPLTNIIYDLAITQDISDRKRIELALLQQEEFFRAIFEQAAVGINISTADGKLIKVNQKICQMLGYTEAELLAITWMDTTAPEFLNRGLEFTAKRHRGEVGDQQFDKQMIRKDGSRFWVNVSISVWKDPINETTYDLAITQDISEQQAAFQERKAAEAQLQANLQEKELLLKEIHHRVKNNLQVISSLLTLQCHNITDPAIAALFEDSQTRIYAIALIHEQLYKTTQFEQINFAEYVVNLVSYLQQLHSSSHNSIQIQTNIKEILLNIETAIPCGLIINELVINALKYAFPQNIHGQLITIELQQLSDQQLVLSIKDNGIGIPNDFDLAEINTLGLLLVKMLTQQLEGEITLTCNPGTQFIIVFSELQYSQRLYVPENS